MVRARIRIVADDAQGWRERRVRLAGRDLFYRVSPGTGDALPIVHLHGFGISGSYLMPTARLLVQHGVNIVPTCRGTAAARGATTPSTSPSWPGRC